MRKVKTAAFYNNKTVNSYQSWLLKFSSFRVPVSVPIPVRGAFPGIYKGRFSCSFAN